LNVRALCRRPPFDVSLLSFQASVIVAERGMLSGVKLLVGKVLKVTFRGKAGQLDKKLTLAPETALLIRETVARINVCLFCIAIGRSVIPSDWRRPAAARERPNVERRIA
jgi:hypothetical protein